MNCKMVISIFIYLQFMQMILALSPIEQRPEILFFGKVSLINSATQQSNMISQTYQIVENLESNHKEIVFGASDIESDGKTPSFSPQQLSWEIKLINASSRLMLKLVTGQDMHWKLQISYLMWDNSYSRIFPIHQNLKLDNKPMMKKIGQDYLLIFKNQEVTMRQEQSENKEIMAIIFLRGYQIKQGWQNRSVIKFKGSYIRQNGLIEFVNQISGIAYCQITILMINLKELNSQSIILEVSFKNHLTSILNEEKNSIDLLREISLEQKGLVPNTETFSPLLNLRFIKLKCPLSMHLDIISKECLTNIQKQEDQNELKEVKKVRDVRLLGHSCDEVPVSCPSSYAYATICYTTKNCKILISQCSAGWYTTADLVSKCTICPSTLLYCIDCGLQYGSSKVVCQTCQSTKILSNGACTGCPVGCATCQMITTGVVTCLTCVSNLITKTSGTIKICDCLSNQYLSTSPIVTCINCPTNCLTCTATACTKCASGYYLQTSTCVLCMPVCKTCLTSLTCDSCPDTTFVMISNVCVCSSPLFFNSATKTCLSCSTIQTNCLSCAYSTTYTASNPPSVICLQPSPSYYILANGSTSQCMNYCLNCAPSNLVCIQCMTNFTYTTSCVCDSPYFFNSLTSTCQICDDVIDGCTACLTQPIPTSTQCNNCDTGYFVSIPYPVTSCQICPSLCFSCTSATYCNSCINNLALITVALTQSCGCTGINFLDPQTLSCIACGSIINNCQTCLTGTVITCQVCNDNYYPTPQALSCLLCPSQCTTCSSSTICTFCQNGYQLQLNGTCTYTSAGSSCLADINSDGNCIVCNLSPGFSCTQCKPGFYVLNPTNCASCVNILSNCLECTPTTCQTCSLPFIYFASTNMCDCNNTNGYYITNSLPTSCTLCSTVITFCTSCINMIGSTQCLSCLAGYYANALRLACLPCSIQCQTCSVSQSNCNSCEVTYVQLSPNVCGCLESSEIFYNSEILGCSPCSTIYANCNDCEKNLTNHTICQTCNSPYFFNAISNQCQMCPDQCSACSSPSVCTGCNFNFVLSSTIGLPAGSCICDYSTIPLTYYDSLTKLCRKCQELITNCMNCSYSTSLICHECPESTYLSGNQCISCPIQCATCNSTQCLSCPLDSTLDDQGYCICEGSCLDCASSSLNCLQCTLVGSLLTSCTSCIPGYFPSDTNCLMCPSACTTCLNSTFCTTCYPTYVINNDGICSCQVEIGLFPSNQGCKLCEVIIYGCQTCDIDTSGNTVCVTCIDGYFTLNNVCYPCNSNCLTCNSLASTCSSCRQGETLDGSNNTCTCGSTCTICNTYVLNCSSCIYDIFGSFVRCETCQAGFYLNNLTCTTCPSNCVSCTTGGQCTSCQYLYEVINGTCQCNNVKNMWENLGTCLLCEAVFPNCQTCISNVTDPMNFTCIACQYRFYEMNNLCIPSVCPDGKVTSGQACDDNNALNGDGCNMFCQTQYSFVCTGEPSVCVMQLNYSITTDSIIVDPLVCNRVKVNFQMDPIYQAYNNVDFKEMLTYISNTYVYYLSWSYDSESGIVSYTFDYKQDLNKRDVVFYFQPSKLLINQTKKIPIIVVKVYFVSSNNLGVIYYEQNVCQNKKALQTITSVVEYSSYATLILTALPCKIVGLEWFGVLQLAHLSVGNMDKVNTLLTPIMGLKNVHGATLDLDKQEQAAGQRRLQSTNILTPDRVKSIGYSANFLRNCNLMFIIVASILAVSFILFLFSFLFQKCAPPLYSLSRRIFKQVILTLVLFNCYNFAYSAGLHFYYASTSDPLYVLGTLAAVSALVLPLMICLVLSLASQEGFGQYKDKLKPGVLQKAYFIVTIVYRTGTGLYVATMNEQELSSLIVLALAILFLLYNLVNLPFTKAYHNYRANICHIAQFICLFVTLYYRSMMSNRQYVDVAVSFIPVYIQYSFILLAFVVTIIVLVYEIYIFIKSCCKSEEKVKRQFAEESQIKKDDEKMPNYESQMNINQKTVQYFE